MAGSVLRLTGAQFRRSIEWLRKNEGSPPSFKPASGDVGGGLRNPVGAIGEGAEKTSPIVSVGLVKNAAQNSADRLGRVLYIAAPEQVITTSPCWFTMVMSMDMIPQPGRDQDSLADDCEGTGRRTSHGGCSDRNA
ncbi:MAG: hypothetical protein WBX25_10630 [Rhodomicrobium sp.]